MSTKEQICIAVVGLQFGAEFVPIYQQHPNVGEVAICDPDEGKLAQIGERFQIQQRFTSLDDLLRLDNYDAVHLVTPIALHVPQTLAVLQAGKHCACAVPMVITIEDLHRIIGMQRRSGKQYMMMETAVYTREFFLAKQLMEEGAFGPIAFLRGAHLQNLEGWPDYWTGYPPMLYMTHAIAPLLSLMKTRASLVHCFGSGELPREMQRYGNPYPVETAIFQLHNSPVAAEITRSKFQMARAYTESFSIYGERMGFEWSQLEEEDPLLFVMEEVLSGRGRPTRVQAPDRAALLPPEIAGFTRRSVYKGSDSPHPLTLGGGHRGSHPHLVHEFVRSIVEDRPPTVDAVTAANWTAPGICAHHSALHNGEGVVIPSFREETGA